MTTTERVSLSIGAVVSLISILSFVWYVAVSFNTLMVAGAEDRDESKLLRETLNSLNVEMRELRSQQEAHKRAIDRMEGGFLEKIYVNHEFSIFKYEEDGNERLIKVPSERVEQ